LNIRHALATTMHVDSAIKTKRFRPIYVSHASGRPRPIGLAPVSMPSHNIEAARTSDGRPLGHIAGQGEADAFRTLLIEAKHLDSNNRSLSRSSPAAAKGDRPHRGVGFWRRDIWVSAADQQCPMRACLVDTAKPRRPGETQCPGPIILASTARISCSSASASHAWLSKWRQARPLCRRSASSNRQIGGPRPVACAAMADAVFGNIERKERAHLRKATKSLFFRSCRHA